MHMMDGQSLFRIRILAVAWQEHDRALWAGGAAPKIELTYDVHNAFLLTVMFQLDKKVISRVNKSSRMVRTACCRVAFSKLFDTPYLCLNNFRWVFLLLQT